MSNPVVDQFHLLYYRSYTKTWMNTRWLGHRAYKCPLDLWVYQEIIHQLRPSLIIETGTNEGGSALFFASMCDLVGQGEVVSIDIIRSDAWPQHPRLTYMQGSSVDPVIVAQVRSRVAALPAGSVVLVCLDSNHSEPHVTAELVAYSDLVTPGSYVVVEDTNVNGRPVPSDWGPGPLEAVQKFLATHPNFHFDLACEKFMMTFNPCGFLRRTS